jgi:phosphoglycolate phosphatase
VSSVRLDPALVMLDLDGTLFDSFEANRAYYDAVLAKLGLAPLDTEGRHLAHHMAMPELFARLFRSDPPLHERALEAARETDYAPFLRRMSPVENLFETLSWLHGRFRTALVTNRGSTIPSVLAHFDLAAHFDLVVGIHDVERPKPAPDMLLHCLTHFSIGAGEAIYVGDSASDLEASRAAGVSFVAVGSVAGAEHRLESVAELPRLLA